MRYRKVIEEHMRNQRKTTPKVKNGRVQKKDRHTLTPNYWSHRQADLQLDVDKTGEGFKHFLKKRDIVKFLEIPPNWEELNIELDAEILAEGGVLTVGIAMEFWQFVLVTRIKLFLFRRNTSQDTKIFSKD